MVEKIANSKTKNLERYGNVPVKTVSIIKAVVIKDTSTKSTEKESLKTEPTNKAKT